MIRVLFFLVFWVVTVQSAFFAQSEISTNFSANWQKLEFRPVGASSFFIKEINDEPYQRAYFAPRISYSRILTDYGLRAGLSVSYMRYRSDIFISGGIAGGGYTEMRFSQVPIQLHLAYRSPFGAYVGLGPSIRLFSSIELTEWYNGENIYEPFLDQGNQLYGVFGFAGYRYKRFDLRLAFERGLGWRLSSTDICSVNNSDPCDYNLSPVHSLTLSLGYVWESGKKKRGSKKRKGRKRQ